jgi:hypothetical protein
MRTSILKELLMLSVLHVAGAHVFAHAFAHAFAHIFAHEF